MGVDSIFLPALGDIEATRRTVSGDDPEAAPCVAGAADLVFKAVQERGAVSLAPVVRGDPKVVDSITGRQPDADDALTIVRPPRQSPTARLRPDQAARHH